MSQLRQHNESLKLEWLETHTNADSEPFVCVNAGFVMVNYLIQGFKWLLICFIEQQAHFPENNECGIISGASCNSLILFPLYLRL